MGQVGWTLPGSDTCVKFSGYITAQFVGGNLDPRTDQFNFCVALYEALYGERPFPSQSLPALIEAVTFGRVREPPQKASVPAWLRKVILRGLRPDPADGLERGPRHVPA